MRVERILNHPSVTGAGMRLAQRLPRRAGYALSEVVATVICRTRPLLYRVVQHNLRHILGPSVGEATLAATTRALFVHAGRANYEFFHAVGKSAREAGATLPLPPARIAQIRAALADGRGVLLLGAHMSNFNLGIPALAAAVDVPIQALSIANPNEGFTLLNQWRKEWGIEITPISAQSLRQAVKRLEMGGVVLTAFDHPAPRKDKLIPFFGQPSYMPLGPARLARIADVLVLLGTCYYDPVRGYVLDTDVLDAEHSNDRQHDTVVNAARMAQILERYVGAHPEQWLMYYPFWPNEDVKGAADGGGAWPAGH
jgi:KDO2-lipid IV(A) lauroyltransferase